MTTQNASKFGPFEEVVDRLDEVEAENGHHRAMCPAHEGHRPALIITIEGQAPNRKLLLHCHAGCGLQEILDALGRAKSDLFERPRTAPTNKKLGPIVETYDYVDPAGDLVFQVTRHDPKDFRQRRPDGNGGWINNINGVDRVLYNLPAVMRTILRHGAVFVVEGEKDCDRANKELAGTEGEFVFTTCPEGSKKWRDSYTQTLRAADVFLIPDNDDPGKEHMNQVANALLPVAKSVRILNLPGVLEDGGDLSDWLDAGGTAEGFDNLVSKASLFLSDHIGSEFGQKEKEGGSSLRLPIKTTDEVLTESGEKPDWIVEGLLVRGGITDLSGLAKYSGKTTFMLHKCACILHGEDFMGYATKKAKVLYITEQGNNFSEALRKAGLDELGENLYVIQQKDIMNIPWDRLIESAVEECATRDIDVLVVDTFASIAGIVGSEENNSGYIREKMEALKKAAQAHNLAVGYLRHAGKRGEARGSSQFEAEGDIILTLKRPEGNQKDTARILEGIGRYDDIPRKLNIELTEAGYVTLGSDSQVEFSKAVRAIKDDTPCSQENALPEQELFDKIKGEGISRSTLRRALTWLVDQGAILKEGKGVKNDPIRYWLATQDPPSPKKKILSDQTLSPKGQKEKDGGSKKKKKVGTDKVVPLFPQEPESSTEVIDNRIVLDENRLEEVVKVLTKVEDVALDLETTGLSPIDDKVRLVSLHTGEGTFLVDCFAVDPKPVLEALEGKTIYVHGAEFDIPFLHYTYGLNPTQINIVDTLHLSQVARAGEWNWKEDGNGWARAKHGLKFALERELGMETGDKAKYQRGKAWTGELSSEHLDYAAGDVLHLKKLAEKLLSLIEERSIEEIWTLEQRAKPLFLAMCCEGIPFDDERWRGLATELEEKVQHLKETADKLAPEHPDDQRWNWNSPQQVIMAFSLVGVEVPDIQRETLSKHDHELIKAVAEYRDTQSLLSRVHKWGKGRYKEGRVYPHWNPAGAATGRSSCTDPNVQSLPKGTFRECIRPKDARVLVKADLNQIELRVLAAITEDENMIEVFRGGGDLHLNTAESIAGRKVSKGDPERQRAKAVNFGLSFGMGAKKFQRVAARDYGVEMTLAQAKEAKKKLLDTYPGIGSWHAKESAKSDAGDFETYTLLGRRRVVEPGYEGKPSFTERLNAPVQGTAADILKLALAKVWEDRDHHQDALPVLTVHDEIVIECDRDSAEDTATWLSSILIDAVEVVLGYPELAGEDAVETEILTSWGGE